MSEKQRRFHFVPSYRAPLEDTFRRFATPMEEFIHRETTGGLLLMLCTVVALVIANSPFAHSYHHLLEIPFGISLGGLTLEKSLHHWINDGVMALFFFVVGLEIKREVLVGELADPRAAALPILAAIGGMITPALLYTLITPSGPAAEGWGIPMATDIAFAVGALVLLGRRVPHGLISFLVALAIVDDLGAVVVIALFYTDQLNMLALAAAAAMMALLILANLAGIRRPTPYFILGALLWLAMLQSGIHATLAGVLTALVIPARSKIDPYRLGQQVRSLMDEYEGQAKPGNTMMPSEEQRSLLQALERGVIATMTPLQRLEHSLHLPVAFVIVPLFALANAGIPLEFSTLSATLAHPATFGVMVGLVLGKLIGIAGVSWLALRLGIGRLPTGTTLSHLVGAGLLGGIGFTMAIFIAELAFVGQAELLLAAKTGVLFASLAAGVGGYAWLRYVAPPAASSAH